MSATGCTCDSNAPHWHTRTVHDLIARAEAAEAKVVRVERLLASWEVDVMGRHIYWGAVPKIRAALAPAPAEDANVARIGQNERVGACEHSPQYQRSECAACGQQVAWCGRCEVDLCGCNPRANDYDGAAADRRAMYDPESGRIDNWSER
jgi:hypothetical protein